MIGHAQHFAAKVSHRRKRLGLTHIDVNRNGGPTAPTVAKAEAGELEDPRPSTLTKFDVGLRWLPGSAASTYWDGDEPKPREERLQHKPVLAPTSGNVSLPLEQVLALMKTQSQINDLLDHSGDSVPKEQIQRVVGELNAHVSTIVGVFVTDLLERNRTLDNTAMQPLLSYAFSELLGAPVKAADPDREERLYRRWLLGNLEGIDARLESTFRRRLRRSTVFRDETR